MNPIVWLIVLALGGGIASKSVRIINQSDEALVETLGRYSGKKTQPRAQLHCALCRSCGVQANRAGKSPRRAAAAVHHPRQCFNQRGCRRILAHRRFRKKPTIRSKISSRPS